MTSFRQIHFKFRVISGREICCGVGKKTTWHFPIESSVHCFMRRSSLDSGGCAFTTIPGHPTLNLNTTHSEPIIFGHLVLWCCAQMLTRGRVKNWVFHCDGWCMKDIIMNDAYKQEMQYHCLLFAVLFAK